MAERVGRFSFGLLTRIECLLILFSVMRSGTFRICKVCLGWDWLNRQHRAHRLCINAHADAPARCGRKRFDAGLDDGEVVNLLLRNHCPENVAGGMCTSAQCAALISNNAAMNTLPEWTDLRFFLELARAGTLSGASRRLV